MADLRQQIASALEASREDLVSFIQTLVQSPSLANDIMGKRVKELEEPGKPIIAYCPICLGNLKKSGANVEDLSTLLVKHI